MASYSDNTVSVSFVRHEPRPRRATAGLSRTLSRYIGRKLLVVVLAVILGFSALAFLIDFIELLRRAGERDGVGMLRVLEMAALHLPFLMQKMIPFAMLFGAMACFQRLTRSQELIAARAVGVSVWQFLLPAVAVALAIGVFATTVLNPLAATLYGRFEKLESVLLKGRSDTMSVSREGVWLRESDMVDDLILHGDALQVEPLAMEDVTVFAFDGASRFVRRIDAASAELRHGYWLLVDTAITDRAGRTREVAELEIPTKITPKGLIESFAKPERVPFWQLPGFIAELDRIGFSTRQHQLYFHQLLALPLLLLAMLIIGVTFSLRLSRKGGAVLLVTGGVVTGFAFYILSDVIFAVGLSGRIPPILAAWSPTGIALLLGSGALFYLEDG
ncbi:MAG: LPS export ABC transporter permease LptG [Geminicoccaceae bacterium]